MMMVMMVVMVMQDDDDGDDGDGERPFGFARNSVLTLTLRRLTLPFWCLTPNH